MTSVSYDRAETRQERDQLAQRLACLSREADALARAVACWCDLVAQEAEARLGIGPGDEDQTVRLTDPVYNEALDRFGQLEELAALARSAAERMNLDRAGEQHTAEERAPCRTGC